MRPEHRAVLSEWARLFDNGEYFEAHEVLERPWLEAEEPDRSLFKGLIHAAVALHHYQRGNGHGARVKYASARRYLEPYAATAAGIDVAALVQDLDRFFSPLLELPAGSRPPVPRGPWPRATPRGMGRAPAPAPNDVMTPAPRLEQRFYVILTAAHFEAAVSFYRDLLEMPQVHAWSDANGSGSMLRAETGIVEIVSAPPGHTAGSRQGVALAIEVPDVDAWHKRLTEKGLPAPMPVTQPWGQRLFTVHDPDGTPVVFFTPAALVLPIA